MSWLLKYSPWSFSCAMIFFNSSLPHPAASAATRFFTIAKRLPMEMQMMLCHHVVGSTKQNILRRDSEAAFKSLARILLS